MSADAAYLSDFKHDRLTIECIPCGRHGEYSVATLRRKFGNPPMDELCRLVAMAGQCPKAMMFPGHDCGAHFVDRYAGTEITLLGPAYKSRWSLSLRCERHHQGLKSVKPCLSMYALDLESLVAAYGHEFPLEQLKRRLCCPGCGSKTFTLYWSKPPAPRKSDPIPLRPAA